MNHRYRHHVLGSLAVLVLVVSVLAGQAAFGATTQQAYVPNQLIVKTTPGLPSADLTKALDAMGAKLVRPIALANTYLVELQPTRGFTVESAVTRASGVPGIVQASPNRIYYPLATPNDTLYDKLWGLTMIHAPQAWDTEKGKATVIVAVNDTGVSTTHPDLQGRLLPGRDVADGDDDVTPSPTVEGMGHGTHVAGTIAAQGDNGLGVTGVCWNGVKILPIKVFPDDIGGAPLSAIIDGLDWALTHGAQVVNMSYGLAGASDPNEHAKLQQLAAAGILLIAAAGNDNGPVVYPAAFPECVAVSALGPTEAKSIYSCFGPEIDIAAPGGAGGAQDSAGEIWSTWWDATAGNGYTGISGTSMAAPHVAGACGLLLSTGLPASSVLTRLYNTARAPAVGTKDPLIYGHGIVDLFAAMEVDATIRITSPTSGQSIDTTSPTIAITTFRVVKDSIKVYLDFPDANKDGYPDDPAENIVVDSTNIDSDPAITYNQATGALTIRWPVAGAEALTAGVHTLAVTGEPTPEATSVIPKDSCTFFIQPHIIKAGRHLLSVPYPLPSGMSPTDVFGTTARLARFIPSRNAYATINYPGQVNDPAGVWPLVDAGVHPHGTTIDTPPAGLGFWLDVLVDTPVAVGTPVETTNSYDIVLTRGTSGWNMIGNPFPFAVPWDSVELTYQGRTLGLADAVAAGWIRAPLYTYTGAGYAFKTAPSALLMPWEGNWIRILPNDSDKPTATMVLTIPPLEVGTSGRSRAATAATTDVSIRLAASVGTTSDSYNFAGVSSRAADAYDSQDVEKPPVQNGYVQLSFLHKDWGVNSGSYASDVRRSIGSGKSWEFQVTTDVPNKDVLVTWPDIITVPKKYTVTIEDLDSGKKVYARTRSAYTYNSGAVPGARRFKLTVAPAEAGSLILTNLTVSRSRGSTFDIGYNVSRSARVEVRLKSPQNRVVRSLGGSVTRAAGINSVHWDGRADDGRNVPAGPYLAEIIATGDDGEVVKSMQTVLVR